MSTSKKIRLAIIAVVFLFIHSCKSPEEPKVVFPENDIPVGQTTDEALPEFMKGLKLYDEGDIINSRKHFKKSTELDSNFVRAHMYVAFTSNSNKQWAENRDKYLAMRDKAEESDLLMMDWLQASLDNKPEKELEVINKMIQKYPKSARAVDYLAGYYNGENEVAKARELWQKAIKLDSSYVPAISNLGNSYLFRSPKDFKLAQNYMEIMVEKLPNSPEARIGLGDAYRAQNNLTEALNNYEKAAELDPNNETAHSKAGHANTFLGNFEKARKNFQNAREVSEFGTGSYNFEAYTYLYEGDHKKALAFLQDGTKTFDAMSIPESNKNQAKMGCAFDCAMIAMHYNDAEHLKELVAMMKPMSDQVSNEVNNPITTKYQKANMYYWDAVAFATEGNYDAAIEKADKLKGIMETIDSPNKLRSYHRVHAVVNYKQGNYEKALEHMAKLNEDNVYVQYMMAKAFEKMGNQEKAKELFTKVAGNNFNSVAYALVRNESKNKITSAN